MSHNSASAAEGATSYVRRYLCGAVRSLQNSCIARAYRATSKLERRLQQVDARDPALLPCGRYLGRWNQGNHRVSPWICRLCICVHPASPTPGQGAPCLRVRRAAKERTGAMQRTGVHIHFRATTRPSTARGGRGLPAANCRVGCLAMRSVLLSRCGCRPRAAAPSSGRNDPARPATKRASCLGHYCAIATRYRVAIPANRPTLCRTRPCLPVPPLRPPLHWATR